MSSALATAILVTVALLLAGSSSAGRDLRPSEHGLFFQASPPVNSSPEMRSFFSTTKGSSDAPVRNATESLPPQWWGVGGGGGGRSHVGQALMTASLVCGITGGVLLVASALLYLFKYRKKPPQNESFRASNNYNNNNNNNYCNNVSHNNNEKKLELVVRDG
ncbi:hypothetical protein PHAVU_006G128300 [Phaseolus vulgaris]|uniref:Uncharacterized protein n=1 Tax=Phaseolus vulgaris TaxID=3885 RepID=V7BR35_PHAVU|nr:hypothetical protein PHAVU_006G128300g [Phaseolus vulgaris]ESW19478.1 hypothetical protein PHAVU_006G128300g [Phaseolus vulgaris]